MAIIRMGDLSVECCPNCGGKSIYIHSMTMKDGQMTADIECLTCRHREQYPPRVEAEKPKLLLPG